MSQKNKIYFASDFHLGSPNEKDSLIREKKICRWFDSIQDEAKEIFLVGDIFDFWFEYKRVIPKGFERFKGKIAELSDQGIKIHFFPGNHDLWTFGYLESELGLVVHKKPLIITINNKTFYITHGDGLGKRDLKYNFIKSIFSSQICQWMFSKIPSSLGIKIAHSWSKMSRKKGEKIDNTKLKDDLISHSKKILANTNINYFIYGHIHEPIEIELTPTSKYINLGDWITHFSYLEFNQSNLLFKYF